MSLLSRTYRLLRSAAMRSGWFIDRASFGQDLAKDLKIVLSRSPVSTVLDIGANRGESAVWFLTLFPQAIVHAFEPSVKSLAALRQVARRNGRLRVHPVGLGERDAEDLFHIAERNEGSSFLPLAAHVPKASSGWQCVEETRHATLRRLDSLSTELGIETIDFMKIDTQGYDLHVLRGAGELWGRVPIRAILVETNFVTYYEGQATFRQLFDFLSERGFRLSGFYNPSRDTGGALDSCDALFVAA